MPSLKLPTTLIQTLQTHSGSINTITFSNLGGTYILTGSSDRSINLSRTEPSSSNNKNDSSSSSVHNNNVVTTKPIQKYTSHGYPVLSISVSSQNTHFASSGGDRSIFYWDIQTPDTTVRRFGSNTTQAHSARITCVSFAGERRGVGDASSSNNDNGIGGGDSVLISGSDDKTVRLWDVKSRDARPIQVWEEAKDAVSALLVEGVEVVTGSVDGRLRTYDLRMGKVTIDVQPGAVTSLDLTVDAKCLLVGCLDGGIRLMDRLNGACLRVFPGEDEKQNGGYKNEGLRLQSCLAANDELVLTGSEGDGKVRVWDVLSGKLVGNHEVSESDKVVSVVRWREGSKALDRRAVWAAGGADGVVRVYR